MTILHTGIYLQSVYNVRPNVDPSPCKYDDFSPSEPLHP